MSIPEYKDPDYDLKQSFLVLLPLFTAQEIVVYLGMKREKLVRWLKTDPGFGKAVLNATRRDV